MDDFIAAFDQTVDNALFWLGDHAAFLFDAIRDGLDGFYALILGAVTLTPFWVVTIIVALIGWRIAGRSVGAGALVGLALCSLMGLWLQTMQTLALVLSATIIALVIALPLGILAGYMTRLDKLIEPALDLIQTLPPYIYLLPAIALLGYGSATALVATIIVAVPPVIRLTALGIRRPPWSFKSLARRTG